MEAGYEELVETKLSAMVRNLYYAGSYTRQNELHSELVKALTNEMLNKI